jgi:hypothetical protein
MMMRILGRLIASLLLLLLVYLVGVNLLLAMPQTRDFLNRLQPEQFSISWERAWTWYPLRVELQGAHADGQTRKEQWQVDARRAGASLSLLALLQGRIDVHDIDVYDMDLRLRPRRKAGGDNSGVREFFPVISNRDPDALAQEKRKPKKTFLITLEDLSLRGDHSFWVAAAKGEVSGSLSGNFAMNTDGGRIALDAGTLDLKVGSLSLLGVDETSSGALIEGSLAIPTMYASDLTTADGIRRVDINASIDLPVDTLEFLEPLVGGLGDASITGKGRASGRLHQRDGALQADTDLRVEATELTLRLPPYAFDGDGVVRLRVDSADDELMILDLRFGKVSGLLHPQGQEQSLVLFTGRDLEAILRSEPNGADAAALSLKMRIPEVSVADMGVYDVLIPPNTGLELLGGRGNLAALVSLQSDELEIALDLSSAAAQVRYGALQGRTNLDFEIRARAQRDLGAILDVSGTSLTLDDTRLSRDGSTTGEAAPWSLRLDVATGNLAVPLVERGDDQDELAGLREAISEGGIGVLLDDASGELQAGLQVSSLDWIAALLGRPLGMTLNGSGQINARLLLENGQPAKGTRLVVQPEALSLGIMDHLIAGQGSATLSVEPQANAPLLRALVALSDATMRRIGEDQASVEQVTFEADIQASRAMTGEAEMARVDLRIPSARVVDMSAFNAYLPENAPVVITSGEADLLGELHAGLDKVEGELLLTADGIGVELDDVGLSGDLRLTGLIVGGDPEAMRFDVTGSSLLFDNFDVDGANASHEGSRWGARIQLDQSELVWNKPMKLSTKAIMTVTDTRPFVAMMENARGEHGWINELLTLSDLAGSLRLSMDGQGAIIHDAFLGSDKASISARGLSHADHREALLLVRYKRLSGSLAMQDGQSRFSILGARERFAAYVPGETELPTRGIKVADRESQDGAERITEQDDKPGSPPRRDSER